MFRVGVEGTARMTVSGVRHRVRVGDGGKVRSGHYARALGQSTDLGHLRARPLVKQPNRSIRHRISCGAETLALE